MVGAVTPKSVSIIKINGADPGKAYSIPSSATAPGLGGGGTAYKTKTNSSSGEITIIIKGTECTDAKLFVFYVRSATDVQVESAEFSVID